MKICFSSYDDVKNPYYGGGGAIAIHEVASRLAQFHKVIIYTARFPGSANEVRDNVEYIRIGTNLFGPRAGQLIFQLLLPWYVLTRPFDVWIESFTPPFSTAFLQLFTAKPVVGLCHLLAGREMSQKYKLPFVPIEYIGIKAYKYFIAVTKEQKKYITQINKNAIVTVIPNGFGAVRTSKRTIKPKHLLFLGRLDIYQKGLDLLLQSYKHIVKQSPYDLVIAGRGTEEAEKQLRKLIVSLRLEKRVHFVGYVDGAYKTKLLRQSAALVVSSRFESFGLAILEALGFGIPVITFDIPNLGWIPDHLVTRIPFNDTRKLAKAMLATNNNYIKHTGKPVDTTLKQYQWDRILPEYQSFLSLVCFQQKKTYWV